EGQQNADRERSKNWQAVYPCYFDNTRSRIEGRRVKQNEAIANPLAREIVDAVQSLGLVPIFEPGKTHPKDWSNPGRVRVQIKKEGRPVTRNIKNKHHLYKLIAAYLQSHPTNPSTPLRLRVAGLPPPKEPNPPPAVPRGWKIGTILPLHSPALSGGGVSDNILKDMMAEMQGQLPEGSGSAEARKKKEKK
ncbi:signal recognition particle, SRP19 subunit, partial [Patellaria atrata CBS 101060]